MPKKNTEKSPPSIGDKEGHLQPLPAFVWVDAISDLSHVCLLARVAVTLFPSQSAGRTSCPPVVPRPTPRSERGATSSTLVCSPPPSLGIPFGRWFCSLHLFYRSDPPSLPPFVHSPWESSETLSSVRIHSHRGRRRRRMIPVGEGERGKPIRSCAQESVRGGER